MAFEEYFDHVYITGATPSTVVTLDAQTLSADTIYLDGMPITDLSANTGMVRTSTGFTIIGYLQDVISDSLEIDTVTGKLHLKGDELNPGGSKVRGTDVFGNLGYFDIDFSGLTAGEVNDGVNIGNQIEIFEDKVGVDLRFRTLSAGTGVSITQEDSAVTFSSTVNAPGGVSDSVQFNNAGTFDGEWDFVYKSDNLGIGTNAPLAKVHVSGSSIVTDSFTNLPLTSSTSHAANYLGVFVDPATGTIYSNDPSTGDTYVATANTQGVIPGNNLYTGGTIESPIIGLNTDISLTTITVDSMSADTLYLSGTDIITVIQGEYMGVFTGLSVSISGSNYIDVVGTGNTVGIELADDIYADTVSGGTLYSGSTDLYDIFVTTASITGVTSIDDGVNTYVTGSVTVPVVNVSGGSFDNIYVSGVTSVGAISATTIYSGSTDLSELFGSGIVNGTGSPTHITFWSDTNTISGYSQFTTTKNGGTGYVDVFADGSIRATQNLTGATIYSGSTDLSLLFAPIGSVGGGGDITRVSDGLNTYTGGTINIPSVNISGGSFDNIYVSGVTSVGDISATTIYSGSTDLSFLFSKSGIYVEEVSAGSNITIGGTQANPVVAVEASPSFTNVGAATVTATNFVSGATNLNNIFAPIGSIGGDTTRIANGLNTYTGGTINIPNVNISGLSINNLSASGTVAFAGLSSSGDSVVMASTSGVLSTGSTQEINGIDIAFGSISATTINIMGSGSTNCLVMEDQVTGIEYQIYLSGGGFVFVGT